MTGVDLDPAMLDRARKRASGTAAEDRLTLVEADIVGLRLPDAGRFGLAFIALNSLLVLPTRTAQRAAVRALADHLGPGGARRRRCLAPGCRGPRPLRRPDHARVAAARSGDRRDRDQGRLGAARRGERERDPDHDLRGRRPGRADPSLAAPRPVAPRLGRRTARLCRGRRADRGSHGRRLRHGSRWAPAASARSSSR